MIIKNDLPFEKSDYEEKIFTHPTMLFRYSAITFNGHRIHYDYPYSTEEEGYKDNFGASIHHQSAIQNEIEMLEAELEAARLLVYKSAWMMDNKMPNSKEASMGKAKAGRIGNKISLKCVEICSMQGFSEDNLLEKFSRDSKILDIFEGTQQIQQLIVARQVLKKSSSELK